MDVCTSHTRFSLSRPYFLVHHFHLIPQLSCLLAQPLYFIPSYFCSILSSPLPFLTSKGKLWRLELSSCGYIYLLSFFLSFALHFLRCAKLAFLSDLCVSERFHVYIHIYTCTRTHQAGAVTENGIRFPIKIMAE